MFYLVTILFIGKQTVFWSIPFASELSPLKGIVHVSADLERAFEIEKNWQDQERRRNRIKVNLDRLQRAGEEYFRLSQAVDFALQPPGLLESIAKLEQLKRSEDMSPEEGRQSKA